jgi:hypothetical protein
MTSRPECTNPRVNRGRELQYYSPPARGHGQEGKRLGPDEPQVLDVIPPMLELEGLSESTAGREHSVAWDLGAWLGTGQKLPLGDKTGGGHRASLLVEWHQGRS